ncbi:recombinase family protein [Roseomonas genomospecies 6]|uniref:Resolvase n=1 Tax=Roseomonas genomospecies 6 TaxID=214106 RepID=A0A9W7NLA6_9PROT|nr:recombinase family protein [Roseomonas genomospecies 6]KAA0681999.1 resolvase [Roseomonas genomospecies 6]
MRVAIYARVSTDRNQTVENQLRDLTQVAQHLGWTIVEVFRDEGISGAKGRDQRPGFDRLLKGVARREFDLIAAWSVDRLGRSLQDLVAFLGEINARGVGLYLHQQGLDTTTPAGRAMFQMLGIFSEFERAMIQDRIRAGLNRARAEGRRLGRPKTSDAILARIRRELDAGHGIHKTAKLVGCGVGTVQKVKKEIAATPLI